MANAYLSEELVKSLFSLQKKKKTWSKGGPFKFKKSHLESLIYNEILKKLLTAICINITFNHFNPKKGHESSYDRMLNFSKRLFGYLSNLKNLF